MTTKIGARITLTETVDVYPTGVFEKGLTGTLVNIDEEGSYWVRLDQHFDALNDWNNELQIYDWSADNNGEFHPETYLNGDNLTDMCAEYQARLTELGLPQMSADELLSEDLTAEQRKYVAAFSNRWDVMMARGGDR